MITSVLTLSPSIHKRPMIVYSSFPLQIISGVRDMPLNGAGSDGGGAAEIDFGAGVAHAPGEVAVHGGEGALAGGKDAEMPPDAGAAAGNANGRPGPRENLQVTQAHGLKIDLS